MDFLVGTFLGPRSEEARSKGFVGLDLSVLRNNLWSDYRPEFWGATPSSEAKISETRADFFSVFAVFFPAVTGIVAGANLSGDLKVPTTLLYIDL